jgi:hypothetical protein
LLKSPTATKAEFWPVGKLVGAEKLGGEHPDNARAVRPEKSSETTINNTIEMRITAANQALLNCVFDFTARHSR